MTAKSRNIRSKIIDLSPRAVKQELKSIGPFIQIVPEHGEDMEKIRPVFRAIFASYRRLTGIRLWYDDDADPGCCTLLYPYRLVYIGHSWWVLGRSSYHRKPCWFRLSRILRYEETETPFVMPDRFPLKHYIQMFQWKSGKDRTAEPEM